MASLWILVVSLSSWESLVLFSNRVCAVSAGFFHLLCMAELNGPNGNACGCDIGVFICKTLIFHEDLHI